jgi:hypothetical protein
MDEMWTPRCRYKVSNGAKVVDMRLKQHLPSHLLIAGMLRCSRMMISPQHAADVMRWDTPDMAAHVEDFLLPLKPYHTRTHGPI